MDAGEARKYMKMCVDSGLWNANDPNEFDEPADEEVQSLDDDVEVDNDNAGVE